MSQVVSLSFFRFDTAARRAWALWMMAAARRSIAATPDIGFWKLCGSGGGEGFTPRINIDTIAILATWPDLQIAHDRTQTATAFMRYHTKADEAWSVFMATDSVRGAWAGQMPFVASRTRIKGPLAVLTRATVKPSTLARFWKRVPDISERIGVDPNVAFKIGIGETPLLQQITFSIWPDARTMASFARTGAHADAIRAVRDEDWFQEELYARFTLLSEAGTWGGTSPLTGLSP